jgi:hypothetical protein
MKIEKSTYYDFTTNLCFVDNSVLDYDVLNLEVPTLPIVGSLIKAGVRVLIYRYLEVTEPKLFLLILWL